MSKENSNPGSKAAIDLGCTCPVMDNHYGKGIPMRHPENGEMQRTFWVDGSCPIHGLNKDGLKG